ncbi:MAG: PD-(D/E)XK nuclease family protein [Sedimentisphaerales bacterium]
MVTEFEILSKAIPKLIRELGEIKVRRDTFIRATKARFNVFTTLRKAHEEVGLHSRFLALLLNAKGSHDCGNLFLNLFLEVLKEQGIDKNLGEPDGSNFLDKCLGDTFKNILRETPLGKDYGRIDIGVVFQDSILIIENKIYAGEQSDQISRYVEYLNDCGKHNKALIYLTLDGKEPETAGEYKGEYYCISYSEHILRWLDRCLEKTYKYPNINTAIQQYKDVVAELVGKNTLAETNMKEMEDLIKKYPELFEYASEINQSVENLKKYFLDSFWISLKLKLKNRGIDIDSKEINEKTYVGFFLTSSLDLDKIFNFFVQKDQDQRCWYGISLIKYDNSRKDDYFKQYNSEFDRVRNALDKDSTFDVIDTPNNPWWPIGRTIMFSPGNEWFEKVITDKSQIDLEVNKAADGLLGYIKFVTAEWNKAVKSNSNEAS